MPPRQIMDAQKIDSLFPGLKRKIKGQRLFFFSDFDGTLAPIRRDPAKVALAMRVRNLLKALTLRMPVAIISGRPLTYLHKIIDMPEIILAGNHGLEIDMAVGKREKFRHPQAVACKEIIHELALGLKQAIKGARHLQGVRVEDKGLTLTFHYRAVSPIWHETSFKIFDEIFKPFQSDALLRIHRGKMCFEVRPNIDWGKAEAMQWILDAYQNRHGTSFPIYMGDDETDKPAIALAHQMGLSLFKGDSTCRIAAAEATYSVETHEEVVCFMRHLSLL